MNSTNNPQSLANYMHTRDVLKFGEFTLKSGRKSPYFFNLGVLSTGQAFIRLGEAYACEVARIMDEHGLSPWEVVLFWPAYKGIPLVTATSIALEENGSNGNVGVAYNRKEAKSHGEGGVLVGAWVAGKQVILIDDVLTAGTAISASVELLRSQNASPLAAVVALDRQEVRSEEDRRSAVQAATQDLRIDVRSLLTFTDIREYARWSFDSKLTEAMDEYASRYGVK